MAETINPGEFDRRITFQSPPSGTPDANGDAEAGTWTDVLTVWAKLRTVSTGEAMRAGALGNELTHRIWCRYRPEINAQMRIKLGSRLFAMVGAPRDLDDRQEYFEIAAVEGSGLV